MCINRDTRYTRTQIQQLVGGEIQTYLPQRNRIILAGCFNLELNPDAPNQIQAGIGPQISAKARLLSEQPETVFPVFLKKTERDRYYSYIGNYQYRPNSITNDPNQIQEAERRSGRYGQLSYLFDLLEVP